LLIQGQWHSAGSAAQSSATLRSVEGLFTVESEDGLSLSGKIEDIEVSDRLGNVERKLAFEDGSVFSTEDNAAVDSLFHQNKSISGFVHAFESNTGWVAFALVAIVVFSFSFFKWGLPWASNQIADALPHKTNELIGQGGLEFLDEYIFDESELDEKQIEQIRAHFVVELLPLEPSSAAIDYRLHFRKWGSEKRGIPNALALPSGDIVLTDKFVELTQSQDEIDAVLLHEMGHVQNRHGLQMLIEGSIVTVIVMLVTGDNSGIVDMGLGVGSLLVSSNYARGHESEADLYAFERMLDAQMDPQAFSNIMRRMTEYMQGTKTRSGDQLREAKDEDRNLMDYLSSHPNTAERIERAKRYSECFQRGLADCDIGGL
jgi:Zn-dependent protease with chaperone function